MDSEQRWTREEITERELTEFVEAVRKRFPRYDFGPHGMELRRVLPLLIATPDAAPRSADASPDYAQEVQEVARKWVRHILGDDIPDDEADAACCTDDLTRLAQRVARETREACAKRLDRMAELCSSEDTAELYRLAAKDTRSLRTAHGEAEQEPTEVTE